MFKVETDSSQIEYSVCNFPAHLFLGVQYCNCWYKQFLPAKTRKIHFVTSINEIASFHLYLKKKRILIQRFLKISCGDYRRLIWFSCIFAFSCVLPNDVFIHVINKTEKSST